MERPAAFTRECDMGIVNSSPTREEMEKHWRKFEENDMKRTRKIFAFQCFFCRECYNNHKNVGQHLLRCPILHHPPHGQKSIILYMTNDQETEVPKNHKYEEIMDVYIGLYARKKIVGTYLQSLATRRSRFVRSK